MKKLVFFLVLFNALPCVYSQTAFHNSGNIQMHTNAQVGFHTNVINDGTFNKNEGSAGFYDLDQPIIVSGKNKMIFKDVTVEVFDDLFLSTSIGVTNDLFLSMGRVNTPTNDKSVSLDFLDNRMYVGADDNRHVDGYALVTNSGEFTFPIGNAGFLRPMILPNSPRTGTFKGAYFKLDPNYPNTAATPTAFTTAFDTNAKDITLTTVNTEEFWDLDGSDVTSIKLTWDKNSNLGALTQKINDLRVVGWSNDLGFWVDLGNAAAIGDINNGIIQSTPFIPDDFEVITIGSGKSEENVVFGNYGISPNGDGVNDTFKIKGIEISHNNTLRIYNRWSLLVYSKNDYDNSWEGFSDNKLNVKRELGLPDGTYFYVLDFHDLGISWQGWVYVKR
jgi:gliding motility-associated-like protein